MNILSVIVQGFRSFSAPQTWAIGNSAAGLYNLTGRNNAEPELEANGAGKSTLFEALYWCLYGRTSRGLKAGNVQSWLPDSPKCCVVVKTDAFVLTRTWGPNRLELDGRPVEQADVDRAIGIGPEAFLQAVYHAQFSPNFVDLPPTERLSLLSEVLNLDLWENASERAGKLSRELEKKAGELREHIARNEGALEQLRANNLEEQIQAWDKSAKEQLVKTEARLAAAEGDLKKAASALATAKRRSAAVAKAPDFSTLEAARTNTAQELNAVQFRVSEVERDLVKVRRELDLPAQVTCRSCGQRLTDAALKKIAANTAALVEQRATLEGQLATYTLALDQALDNARIAQEELASARERDAQRSALQVTVTAELARAEADVRQAQTTIERITAERTALLRKENPYVVERARVEAELVKVEATLLPLRNDLAETTQLSAGAAYWQKGFRDVRLFVVDRTLAQLEIEVNGSLTALGLNDWAVRFSVEQETKSGTLRRGFSVLVKAPHSAEAVPFEVWSGGEAQRLRLAVAMGIADLISGQTGFDCNLELWDEPSTWMSAAGITDMLAALSDRAERRNRSVWLADHRSLDYGGFVGGLLVVKEKGGSRLEATAKEGPSMRESTSKSGLGASQTGEGVYTPRPPSSGAKIRPRTALIRNR